jgi:hypothetical protein
MDKKQLNIPDIIEAVDRAGRRIASSITPIDAAGGNDATGGRVESLTEAVMGMTAGLVQIAHALSEVADTIREGRESV